MNPKGRTPVPWSQCGHLKAILRELSQGYIAKEIALRLDLPVTAIRGRRDVIRRKLKARNSCHAVALALRDGLIPFP